MHILDRFTHAPRVTQKLLDPPSIAALLHFSCYVSSKILPSGLGLVGATSLLGLVWLVQPSWH